MDRPAVRFSQVINAGPEELAADIIVIPYSLPGLIAVSVFTAQERQGGKTAVILFIQMLFIVVAHHIQRVEIMQPGGKLRECCGQRYRACGIVLSYNAGQLCRDGRKPFHVRLIRIVHPLRGGLIFVIVARHFSK